MPTMFIDTHRGFCEFVKTMFVCLKSSCVCSRALLCVCITGHLQVPLFLGALSPDERRVDRTTSLGEKGYRRTRVLVESRGWKIGGWGGASSRIQTCFWVRSCLTYELLCAAALIEYTSALRGGCPRYEAGRGGRHAWGDGIRPCKPIGTHVTTLGGWRGLVRITPTHRHPS
jgi:hypothetical protein